MLMARNIDDIQRDIERTRRQLAGTLDEIAARTRPATLVEEARTSAVSSLKEPRVQAIVVGATAVVAGLIVAGLLRSKKKTKELKEIQKLLAARV